MNKRVGKHQNFIRPLNRGSLRLIILIACLILFVLSAGAPGSLGGIGMNSTGEFSGSGSSMGCLVVEFLSENGLEHLGQNALVHVCMP